METLVCTGLNSYLEQFSVKCCKAKTDEITLASHKLRLRTQRSEPVKTQSKYNVHVAEAMHGKTCVIDPKLVLVIFQGIPALMINFIAILFILLYSIL